MEKIYSNVFAFLFFRRFCFDWNWKFCLNFKMNPKSEVNFENSFKVQIFSLQLFRKSKFLNFQNYSFLIQNSPNSKFHKIDFLLLFYGKMISKCERKSNKTKIKWNSVKISCLSFYKKNQILSLFQHRKEFRLRFQKLIFFLFQSVAF